MKSNGTLGPKWERALELLYFEFQPIALSHDGRSYGFEALLRGYVDAGFGTIGAVFDEAYLEEALADIDLRLRAKAMTDFSLLAPGGAKLFYNLDNRLFLLPDNGLSETVEVTYGLGLSPSRVVLELSERHEMEGDEIFERAVALCRGFGFRIAIDDFGSGYAGLKLLRASEPDIVKIDRHFVSGSGGDPRKAAFLEKIVGMAHIMGVVVVAEGVEEESECSTCIEAGCDMLQGFLLARPARGTGAFAPAYLLGQMTGSEARRGRPFELAIAASSIAEVAPVRNDDGFAEILDRFRKQPGLDTLPVVDSSGEPVGIYLERDFRKFVYSPYGISLLRHLQAGQGPATLMQKVPIVPRDTSLPRALEVFGARPGAGGIVVTIDSCYAGIVTTEKLLSLVAELEIAEARDQSPLTRLPGNLRVAEVISRRLVETGRGRLFAYFDFDDFKPFNDRYGFRRGDRVIQLFADILRAVFHVNGDFIGHLGGDDFFASAYSESEEEARAAIDEAVFRFEREVVSFYSAEDRERGWIQGKDRFGEVRKMPLMGVSAAAVIAGPGARPDAEALSDTLAELKKEAKTSGTRVALRVEASEPDQGKSSQAVGGPAFAVFTPSLRL